MSAKYKFKLGRPLKVVTVCGVDQGSSLIMKMFVDDVLKELGVPARVEPTEIITAKAAGRAQPSSASRRAGTSGSLRRAPRPYSSRRPSASSRTTP